MDVPDRTIDREDVGERVKDRLESEAETADEERARYLVDVSYDLEAWAPVEAGDVRERLDESLAADESP